MPQFVPRAVYLQSGEPRKRPGLGRCLEPAAYAARLAGVAVQQRCDGSGAEHAAGTREESAPGYFGHGLILLIQSPQMAGGCQAEVVTNVSP